MFHSYCTAAASTRDPAPSCLTHSLSDPHSRSEAFAALVPPALATMMQPEVELCLYREYIGTIQRTLTWHDTESLGPYVSVTGVHLDVGGEIIFECTEVHGPTVNNPQTVRGSADELMHFVCDKFQRRLVHGIYALDSPEDPVPNRAAAVEAMMAPVQALENALATWIKGGCHEALLGIAATPIASELSRARAQIETKLVSLPPTVKQLLVSLFDKQVMPLLIEAFRLRSAELARHVNHNTCTDTTLEQHLEQCAEGLAADFAKHVMTLPAQYDKGRVQQSRDAKGRAEAQLAKARSEVKSLLDDVKMRKAIDDADREVLTLRKAMGVTRTEKLSVVAEHARNNPQHSRHFASLTGAEERLAALQKKGAKVCALTDEALGEQRRYAEAELSASQRIFDSVAADMMARERELDQVHSEAGKLRSIEWRQVLQSWVDEVRAQVLPLAGDGIGAIQLAFQSLPSSLHGKLSDALTKPLSSAAGPSIRRLVKSELVDVSERAIEALRTGACVDCVLCQDASGAGRWRAEKDLVDTHDGNAGPGGNLSSLCGWCAGVCHAERRNCWKQPLNTTGHGWPSQETTKLGLASLCLQPMPFLLWLGLNDVSTLSDVSAAYRRLSKVHHPDRGGDLVKWEITRTCKQSLSSEAQLIQYVHGRNHREFVSSRPDELSNHERIERRMRAAGEAPMNSRAPLPGRLPAAGTRGRQCRVRIWRPQKVRSPRGPELARAAHEQGVGARRRATLQPSARPARDLVEAARRQHPVRRRARDLVRARQPRAVDDHLQGSAQLYRVRGARRPGRRVLLRAPVSRARAQERRVGERVVGAQLLHRARRQGRQGRRGRRGRREGQAPAAL